MVESITMTERPFQMLLLEKIRKRLNENQSLIDDITDILEISKDSGYRRMRGETALSFDEAISLAAHFQISLSEVSGQTDHSSIFIRQPFINTLDDYRQYLQRSIETLKFIKDRRNHLMMYSAKDIPISINLLFPNWPLSKYMFGSNLYIISKPLMIITIVSVIFRKSYWISLMNSGQYFRKSIPWRSGTIPPS
ncbi:MAG: hypothetical protein U5L96_16385 [Owenweeksia sp.]|nr:hypothetical protein [Owenweeksia sp.]